MESQVQATIFITKDDRILVKIGDKYYNGSEHMNKIYEDYKVMSTEDLLELVSRTDEQDYHNFIASHVLDSRRKPTEDITSFRGEYSFLSNMYQCEVLLNGISYRCAESAFQSAKTDDHMAHTKLRLMNGKEAKAYGRKLDLRSNWDNVKLEVMHTVLISKFSRNPLLFDKLKATGDKYLEEGNLWHDNYWGNCTCPKCVTIPSENNLGKLLMKVRDELNHKDIMTTVTNTDLKL